MAPKKSKNRRRTESQITETVVKAKTPKPLPIEAKKEEILKVVEKHQVSIVIGSTGCGKSTQIPQILYRANYTEKGIIACTQPRRIGAFSLATRVAAEMKCELGTLVGYKVRCEDVWDETTKVLYLTDGSLVKACPKNLRLYSVIVLDEVHERSLQTDVLFGLLKKTLKDRPDLRVILSSATINAQHLADYFGGDVPIVSVDGTMFDIETIHEPSAKALHNAVVAKIKDIVRSYDKGDILVFLAGKADIEKVHNLLERLEEPLFVVHSHAELNSKEMRLIHKPAPDGLRKVVLSTNIAETSLTIEGVVFVVDSGRVNRIEHWGRKGINRLSNCWCSRAEADQRRGRAGRTQKGYCFRLYSEKVFEEDMKCSPVPEVTRLDLSSLVLQLKAIGYHNVRSFDFIDPPNATNLKAAHDELHRLGALDGACRLTKRGEKMSRLPLEPKFAAALLHAVNLGCTEEVLRICAIMSAVTGTNVQKLSPQLRSEQFGMDPFVHTLGDFQNFHGDLAALGDIMAQYMELFYHNSTRHDWCWWEEMNDGKLMEAVWVYEDLAECMKRLQIPLSQTDEDPHEAVAEAFLEGGFFNLAEASDSDEFSLWRDGGATSVQQVFLLKSNKFLRFSTKEIVFGLDLMWRPNCKNDRVLTAVTRVPEHVDIGHYLLRLDVCCSHLQWPKEEKPKKIVQPTIRIPKAPPAHQKVKSKKSVAPVVRRGCLKPVNRAVEFDSLQPIPTNPV